MSDYNEGDLVRATKGPETLEGIISLSDREGVPTGIAGFRSGFHRHYPDDLECNGYTVTVIQRAKPALPTEPGAIICWETVHFTGLAVLEKTDQWCYNGVTLNGVALLQEIEDAPFTRLEPVSETAARFAARLHTVVQPKIESSWYTKSTAKAILKQADEIAADFEVQS